MFAFAVASIALLLLLLWLLLLLLWLLLLLLWLLLCPPATILLSAIFNNFILNLSLKIFIRRLKNHLYI
ncbi:hypothetical protein CIN_14620 [Commensalibacter intestini A911]|uniref:Uncharacterized protein n=1 Tax=Commensalibacter intestini A911 TaxID=1088868 RepID=G6F1G6_9PROT|nr:hypothetical protein CIN_14620 [Commensalibacter intestini A911]